MTFHPRNLRKKHEKSSSSWIVSLLFSPLGLFFWIIFCTILSVGLWNSFQNMKHGLVRYEQAQEKLRQTEQKTLKIIEKLNTAQTDFAKEKIARDELQMQKPGETIYVVPQ